RTRSRLRRRYADAPAGAPRGAPCQPELDGASHPLRRAGSWQPSFFFGAIRDFTNPVAQASNLQTTNLRVGSSNLSERASNRAVISGGYGFVAAIFMSRIYRFLCNIFSFVFNGCHRV